MTITKRISLVLLLLTVTVLTALFVVRVAHATSKPGLWIEEATQVDGVYLRKIRDTTGLDINDCYLATRIPGAGQAPVVSVSCVAEPKKP